MKAHFAARNTACSFPGAFHVLLLIFEMTAFLTIRHCCEETYRAERHYICAVATAAPAEKHTEKRNTHYTASNMNDDDIFTITHILRILAHYLNAVFTRLLYANACCSSAVSLMPQDFHYFHFFL